MSNATVSADDNSTTIPAQYYYLYSSKPDVIPSTPHAYRQITFREFQKLTAQYLRSDRGENKWWTGRD